MQPCSEQIKAIKEQPRSWRLHQERNVHAVLADTAILWWHHKSRKRASQPGHQCTEFEAVGKKTERTGDTRRLRRPWDRLVQARTKEEVQAITAGRVIS